MPGFVDRMLQKYDAGDIKGPEDIVLEFVEYYRGLYEKALAKGKTRQLSYLSSVQTNLSQFKRRVQAPPEFKQRLHISKEQASQLAQEKVRNLRDQSIDMQPVDGVQTILDCRTLLNSPNIALRIIALAGLTGRREGEIAVSADFGPPRESQHTRPEYWCHVSGLLKQRSNLKTCEIPLFERRERIVECVRQLRQELGNIRTTDVNRVLAKKIARAMHCHCPSVGKIHAFRKFYVIMAHRYFNDRNCSISRIGSDLLCHRDMNSAVLAYLSMNVVNIDGLSFP